MLCSALLLLSLPTWAAKRVDLDYHVRFLPQSDQAEVVLTVEDGKAIHGFEADLGSRGAYSDFQADGQWQQDDPRHGRWQPPAGKARLSYRVKISHPRGNDRFDARITPNWALLRGDDLVPAVEVRLDERVELVARMTVELPEGWKTVETGWPRIGKNRFRIDDPERVFDRPTGWMLAGHLGSRRAKLGNTDVTVSAPVGEGMRRMDVLTLLTFVWPQVQAVFPRDPAKLLIVGAGDPMWRGGLSAPNSLFLHAGRPLVSENGTSSLLHELVHVFSRIHDTDASDWVSEGLAEYYAIELMRRAGGLSEDRYHRIRADLRQWSKGVKSLRGERSSGPVTARAVLLLQDLDKEIRTRSQQRYSLDDLARGLMRLDRVSTADLVQVSESLMGGASEVLDTALLKAS
ncbi:hypothetical protein FM069_13110 [Pseudomonas mangiferae]|uniref:Peptidase M61 catalytic domain-containing protein n=1 Tax=Pseudomonas mangiferae TaxID=2593654 RepID=A0A553GYD4_9PSED|nr:hypothetical protein [Pseudomonas mangiferae]TRX74508.1 hypothetical protein FM069_13110 [Pseudomonas mangiferae]